MKDWKQNIEQKLHKQKNSFAKINIDKANVQYSEKENKIEQSFKILDR